MIYTDMLAAAEWAPHLILLCSHFLCSVLWREVKALVSPQYMHLMHLPLTSDWLLSALAMKFRRVVQFLRGSPDYF